MNKNKNAFLSIPIQGIRGNKSIYKLIIKTVESSGIRIINYDEISNIPTEDEVIQLSPYSIYKNDIELLKSSQVFLTEITEPSLGVGYEIAIAEYLGLPIIYMYDFLQRTRVSLMVLGSSYKNRITIEYRNKSELEEQLSKAITTLRSNNKKNSNAIVNHFNTKSVNYDKDVNWRQDEKMLTWFKNSMKSCPKCLDLGTGTGLIGAELKKNKSLVVGIDISTEMLNIAKERLDCVVKDDILNLPFLDSQFDGISLRQVLHYVDDYACIKEAHRVLKNDGILASAHVASPSQELFEWWQGLKTIVQPLRKRSYQQKDLYSMYKNIGFKIISSEKYSLKRSDKWNSFIVNSQFKDAYDKVINYFDNTSPRIKKEVQLKIGSEIISYRQDWSLIICKKV